MVAGHKRRTALAVRFTSAASRADADEGLAQEVWAKLHCGSCNVHRMPPLSACARALSPLLCARARPPARRSPPWLAGLMLPEDGSSGFVTSASLSPVSPRPSVSSLGDTNMALRDNLESPQRSWTRVT